MEEKEEYASSRVCERAVNWGRKREFIRNDTPQQEGVGDGEHTAYCCTNKQAPANQFRHVHFEIWELSSTLLIVRSNFSWKKDLKAPSPLPPPSPPSPALSLARDLALLSLRVRAYEHDAYLCCCNVNEDTDSEPVVPPEPEPEQVRPSPSPHSAPR